MADLFITFVHACLVSALSPDIPIKCELVEDVSAKYSTTEECRAQQEKLVDAMGQKMIRGIPQEKIVQFKLGMPWRLYCIEESKKDEFLKDIGAESDGKKPGQDI